MKALRVSTLVNDEITVRILLNAWKLSRSQLLSGFFPQFFLSLDGKRKFNVNDLNKLSLLNANIDFHNNLLEFHHFIWKS